jgi:hypothetical protein
MHQLGNGILAVGRDQEVHVVTHEAIRVNRTSMAYCRFAQHRAIDEIVSIFAEARHAIVAPMHDVQRQIGQD